MKKKTTTNTNMSAALLVKSSVRACPFNGFVFSGFLGFIWLFFYVVNCFTAVVRSGHGNFVRLFNLHQCQNLEKYKFRNAYQ
jgi:hypothetical protein